MNKMASFCFSNFITSQLIRPSLYVKLQEARSNPEASSSFYEQLKSSRRYSKLVEYNGEIWEGEKTKSVNLQYELYRKKLNAIIYRTNGEDEIDFDKNKNDVTCNKMIKQQKNDIHCSIPYFDFEDFLGHSSRSEIPLEKGTVESTFTRITTGAEQELVNEIKEFNLKTWKVLYDEFGWPMNPSCFVSQESTGIKGRGVLRKWGTNNAGDALITRRCPETKQLQIVLIGRTDGSGLFAFPGGFVDSEELQTPAKAVIREFMEEAIGIKELSHQISDEKVNDEFSCTIDVLKEIFGNFKISKSEENHKVQVYFEKDDEIKLGRLVYAGFLDDERNTDNAWIETFAMNWHIDASQDKRLKITAGDDAKAGTARFYNIVNDPYLEELGVKPLENLFASHSNILKKMLQLYFPEDLKAMCLST